MTNLITLTIPNDDHIALRAFGKALEEMALAHELQQITTDATLAMERLHAATVQLAEAAPRMMQELRCEGDELQGRRKQLEIDTTAQQVESLSQQVDELLDVAEQPFMGETVPTTDSTGTLWDERIHSASKALNSDGTWRLRRKPKDMDEPMWLKYIESVKNNTTDDNDDSWDSDRRPGSGGEGGVGVGEFDEEYEAAPVEPPVTPPGDDFNTDAGVVTEQTVAGIPPLPVPPPVVVAPEVTERDFPRLMTFLTERHGKIDVATVNTLLAQDGMSSVQELNAHPDKIGPFVARVKAHLGE